MSKVFISYSSVDEKKARQLAKGLDDIGVEYFFDRKDIEMGDSINESVAGGISECSALVVIVSPASLQSQWVPFEIGHATGRGKKVLPYLTHPSLQLPGYLQNLHFKTRLSDVKKYLKSLYEIGKKDTKKDAEPASSSKKISPKRRDAIRAERNEMLKTHLLVQGGITECSFMQLEDHTDNGYIMYLKFDSKITFAADVLSTIREAFEELFPDISYWGETKFESSGSVGFAFMYIDEHHHAF